jgi:class 3 adenylate cyclase/predicted ATPase
MTFEEVLDQAIDMVRRRGRVTYQTLQRQFRLDETALNDLKDELLFANPHIADEAGRGLVWRGEEATPTTPTHRATPPAQPAGTPASAPTHPASPPAAYHTPDAERRQLTVLFCDLVDSTALASRLDPEDLRDVIRAYQGTCAEVIQRFDGHIAQYLGDGLLVYFGYPQAHEDDAQRAVRTGLELLAAMWPLNTRFVQEQGVRLAVRIGIHTGLVVVGEMGSGGRHEHLALGDTPNLAARLQGLAEPDTVVLSATTAHLVQGYFVCQDRGVQTLKGLDTPVWVAQVVEESAAQSRLDVASATGLTPLVGRAAEVALLRERWAQSTDRRGQVVLLSGEAGIGKSRLVHVLTERVVDMGVQRLTLRCSPYHTNSALYPVIEHLRRLLHWHREETPEARLATLEHALRTVPLPLAETVSLLAALLALPVPEQYPPLTLSPQRQKQKTLEALVAWLLAEAAQQPMLAVWEDLHWADPSTLELLGLLLDQVPTARLLLVLTARPEFHPPWPFRSHQTQFTLTRLVHQQVEEMVLRVTGGKPLPAEVVQQIVVKTDGIPLFVEELVKTVLESGLVREEVDHYVLTGPLPPLAIPATLQDALMARLDRLAAVKEVAQLGAVLGREFSYALLRAVASLDEIELWRGLVQLVQAEVLYQRGVPPQATYLFKHALLQEAAYQSLLQSTRRQYHQRIAQVLAAQFPETAAMQPELLARHYTEAGLPVQALPYWHQAGQHAMARSAYAEAYQHLMTGLEVLATAPETPVRHQHELDLLTALTIALSATKGPSVPEQEPALTRAATLSQQVGEPPQRFAVLQRLFWFRWSRAEFQAAQAVAEQLLDLAQQQPTPALLLGAHHMMGWLLSQIGAFALARTHLEQGTTLSAPQEHASPPITPGGNRNEGVSCRAKLALVLWVLGYPDQAVQQSQEALTLAHALAHPYGLANTLYLSCILHHNRREWPTVQTHAETMLALATEQGFPRYAAVGVWWRGSALAAQGEGVEGIVQMRQGMTAYRATGSAVGPNYLVRLAEAYGQVGQVDEGLPLLAEALAMVDTTGERTLEAELHRLHGELLLRQAVPEAQAAEDRFQQALEVARHQQAKSWELRAAMSLARLWQSQGKRAAARALLAPIYGWFTEGFDTADLKEAKALLDALVQ